MFKIIAIGKIKERIYHSKIDEYIKWIEKYFPIELIFLKENSSSKLDRKLGKYLNAEFFKILLSENGKQMDSRKFTDLIFNQNKKVIFFLGGPHGHTSLVESSCDLSLCLSKMTFPHEMALLILSEQIFRSISIKNNTVYHR